MSILSPFQLLEINLISAQDIAKVSRSMRTYAIAWVHPDRKLTTRVDTTGGTNPTWNDKFIFRVDNKFLQSDTSAIMIEIYAVSWFRDVHVGTVRVLVGNLIPPQTRSPHQNHMGMRFVALQVRRPSGRPQGIVNVGVTVLDSTMRSMPLYTQLSTSALGYQTLMGQDDFLSHKPSGASTNMGSTMAQLRRTKSEKDSTLGGKADIIHDNNEFILPKHKTSTINGSEMSSKVGKKGKVVYDKPLSIIDGADAASHLTLALNLKAQEGKTESALSYSSLTKRSGGSKKTKNKKTTSSASHPDIGVVREIAIGRKGMKADSDVGKKRMIHDNDTNGTNAEHDQMPPVDNSSMKPDQTKDFAAESVWSESEVGPSPSEVAAAIAKDSKYRQFDDGRNSMLDDNMDESEGVRTKLERWRTEMPPAYDHNSSTGSSGSSIIAVTKHKRRQTDGGGKFSCFSNICGLECSIVCGSDGNNVKNKKGYGTKKITRAPSMDAVSYF